MSAPSFRLHLCIERLMMEGSSIERPMPVPDSSPSEKTEKVASYGNPTASFSHADSQAVGDPPTLTQAGPLREPDATHAGRFELLQHHAQGGLGDVYRAQDHELDRQVALKRLRAHRSNNQENQARFLQEARLTAELEHPGVVPIHGLVQDEVGQPCYAMRFVEGETLAGAIQRFHVEVQNSTTPARLFRGVAFRQLLQRFIAVCNTIAFAHSRGILHRDLKPANVLVGPFGETLLVDWGLAKRLDGDFELGEATDQQLTELPQTVVTGGSSKTQLTQAGQILGTPAYMSPEQVDGARLGTVTDVYGLGAILYELLTGRPPIPTAKLQVMLLQVRDGDIKPPRTVQAAVPLALDAICQKALARDPRLRYESALALARDVEQWLADEPVAARPDTRLMRVWRWGKRHRTAVAAGAAAGFIALLGLATATLLLSRINTDLQEANRRERTAAEKARAEAERAERNFLLADEAIGKLLAQINNQKLLRMPSLEPLRAEIQEEALALQERLLADPAFTPAQRRERALALSRSAHVLAYLGRSTEALTRLEEAARLLEDLATDNPNDPLTNYLLAANHNYLGYRLFEAARLDDAFATLKKGQDLLNGQLASSFQPRTAELTEERAKNYLYQSQVLYSMGKRREAISAIHEALTYFTTQLEVPNATPARQAEMRRRVSDIQRNLGLIYNSLGEYSHARKHYLAAVDLLRGYVRQQPNDAAAQAELANALTDLGTFVHHQTSSADGVAFLNDAETHLREALRLVPSNLEFEHQLGMLLLNRHHAHAVLKDEAKVQADLEGATAIFRKLAASAPEVLRYRVDLLKALSGSASWAEGRLPNDQARERFDRMVEYGRTLNREKPNVPVVQVNLAGCLCNFAYFVLIQEKDDATAYASFSEAIELLAPLQPKDHQWMEAQLFLRNCYLGRGQVLERQERYRESLADWRRARELDPEGPFIALCRLSEARNLLHLEEVEDALALLDDFAVPQMNRGASFVEFAVIYGRVGLQSPNEPARRRHAYDQALKLLQQAQAAGAFRSPRWRGYLKHPFFNELKDDPAFQKLLAEVNAATDG